MTKAHAILHDALALPVEERAEIALRLVESLDSSTEPDPIAHENAWAEEVAVRIEAWRKGELKAVPAREALDAARRRLAERRGRAPSSCSR